jgi:hypothetical protein
LLGGTFDRRKRTWFGCFAEPLKSPLPEKKRYKHLKDLGSGLDNEQIEFTVFPPEDYESVLQFMGVAIEAVQEDRG